MALKEDEVFFSGDDHTDEALRAIADLHSLLDQQEYEFQRRIADLQLAVRELQYAASMRKVPSEALPVLEDLPGNVKYCLRAGRENVSEAEGYIADALDRVCSLEMREES